MSEIVSVIFILDDGGQFTALIDVLVDSSGDGGEFGDQGHAVLEGEFPVRFLVETFGVGLSESGLLFQCSDSYQLVSLWGVVAERELGHGVEVAGTSVDEFLDEFRNI